MSFIDDLGFTFAAGGFRAKCFQDKSEVLARQLKIPTATTAMNANPCNPICVPLKEEKKKIIAAKSNAARFHKSRGENQ